MDCYVCGKGIPHDEHSKYYIVLNRPGNPQEVYHVHYDRYDENTCEMEFWNTVLGDYMSQGKVIRYAVELPPLASRSRDESPSGASSRAQAGGHG